MACEVTVEVDRVVHGMGEVKGMGLLKALFRPETGIDPSHEEECSLDHFLLPAL